MIELLPDGNVMNDTGDVVPVSDVFPEDGADMQPLEHPRQSSELTVGSHAVSHLVEEIQTNEKELPVEHEWHTEINIWNRLGLSLYTVADYSTLSSADYNMWQRVMRNYATALQNRFKRIKHKEGRIEYDFELGRMYGDRTPDELLEYASELEELYGVLSSGEILDPEFDDLTKQKLRNAPHYADVAITRSDEERLELVLQPTSTNSRK